MKIEYSQWFDFAMKFVMKHEGIILNKDDPSRYGISIPVLKMQGDQDNDGWVDGDLNHDYEIDVEDLRIMTPEQSKPFYYKQFWQPYHYDELISGQNIKMPLSIITQVFDFAVNVGTGQAHKNFQKALNVFNAGLKIDGIIGMKTRAAIWSVEHTTTEGILASYKATQAQFYFYLAAKYPEYKKYLKGWLNRTYDWEGLFL